MPLRASRPDPRSWLIAEHEATVQLSYDVFGDRIDGTWFGVSASQAHINMPAVLIWADGFEARPVRVHLSSPAGVTWKAATQLYPAGTPLTYLAPNFQYLMDSPVEFGNFATRSFQIPTGDKKSLQTIRVSAHFTGADHDLDEYLTGLKKIVSEEQAIFGELPYFEPGYYTFLLDYAPGNNGDGMEHRNSAVITSHNPLGPKRLGTAAHEFFHAWNVKRIRPAALEPFNYGDTTSTGELWFAEGFTNYYERLVMLRTGGFNFEEGLSQMAGEIGYVQGSPATAFRSAVDMSRLAPFVDGVTSPVPTDLGNTFVSYYSFGDVIAIGLDLSLRDRSNSKVTLDDFMREMWVRYGRPGGSAPGLVGRPYTLADFESTLGSVSGSEAFAREFIRDYICGTKRLDLAPLFLRAGVLLKADRTQPTLGGLNLESDGGNVRVSGPTLVGSPAYMAGLSMDDRLISIAGNAIAKPEDVNKALNAAKPGDEVELVYERKGERLRSHATLAASLALTLMPVEATGGSITEEQRIFRQSWLSARSTAAR